MRVTYLALMPAGPIPRSRRIERKSTSCVTPGPDKLDRLIKQNYPEIQPVKPFLVRTSRMDRRLFGKRGLSAKVPRGMAADGG